MSCVVLAHGCFDILHPGHIDHLKEASKMGGWLVVSITADEFVNKGEGRPYLTTTDRAKILRALRFVDEVIVSKSSDAVEVIEAVRPAIYVKGPDYADRPDDEALQREIAAINTVGGRFATTTAVKSGSSTAIFDRMGCSAA